MCGHISSYPPCYPDTTRCITLVFMSIYVALAPVLPRRYRVYHPCVHVNVCRHIPVLPDTNGCITLCLCQYMSPYPPCYPDTTGCITLVFMSIYVAISPVLPRRYRVYHPCVYVNLCHHIPRVIQTLPGVSPLCLCQYMSPYPPCSYIDINTRVIHPVVSG